MTKKLIILTLFLVISCKNEVTVQEDENSKDSQPEVAIDEPEVAIDEPEVAIDGVLSNEHRVFITSSLHTGDLGGIVGANTICQNLATTAGLERSYKALLALKGENALSNIEDLGSLFVFSSNDIKTKVSNSISDFIQNNILFDVALDEDFTDLTSANLKVYTGIDRDGLSAETCDDWTSTIYAPGAHVGYPTSDPACENPDNPMVGMAWMYQNKIDCEINDLVWNENIGTYSVGGFAVVCGNNSARIYCLSQP